MERVDSIYGMRHDATPCFFLRNFLDETHRTMVYDQLLLLRRCIWIVPSS